MASAVYQIVTDRVIQLLEKGVCPWRKPWRSGAEGLEAQNLVSRHAYRGVNWLLLNSLGYSSPFFLTYNQAVELGGHVKKGEHGFPVIFWKFLDVEESDDRGQVTQKRVPLLRYYTVFNVEQTEGIPAEKIPESLPSSPRVPCESVVSSYRGGPAIEHKGARAFYSPLLDTVTMPPKAAFDAEEPYWRTLYHELTHSTGHVSRFKRFTADDQFQFSSGSYSREELVAEMGAAFLCASTGISSDAGLENSAAYVGSWMRVLKDSKNSRLIVEAAGKAQKAADMILGKGGEEGGEA